MDATRLAHPERADAYRLLREKGVAVGRVVAVDVDSILYVDRQGKPMTAWVRREGQAVMVRSEDGFVA